ncbi:sodium:proton antiporter NhaD [Segetibacter koreensis]|uniref:sodium:proton antiporter NhaD n=1 Tax=Segetibacter koreensis TaxID=398037 RepID=UPI0003683E07|nr:sodium:proton antiporter NhaD [Segetibacter koreensis]
MVILLTVTFVIGYMAIAAENLININKAATALITGVLCWTIYISNSSDKHHVAEQLTDNLGELSGILFFLMGAMTIVELIDAHCGFDIITRRITQTDKRKLLWIISLITFFLSPLLDNLTTTIVMISLLRKLVKEPKERLFFAGMIVIAANVGGAWSPIGDVTTTMLWIGNQITAGNIVKQLILPSLACLLTPLIILSIRLKGRIERPVMDADSNASLVSKRQQYIVFFAGVIVLISVPVFKSVTHLPPYMGILIGLGILWIITEIIHGKKNEEDKHILSVAYALQKIDTPSILFFLGILISIAALQVTGVLSALAVWMNATLPNDKIIVISMGLLSSIVDNVPLVAASQGMYSLNQYPTDHYFWEFLAYCTGTGGSVLIIGSAAGIAAMGIEKISFFWYIKHISLLALLGYFAGIGVYLLQYYISS